MAVQQGYGKMAGANSLVFAYDTGDTVNSFKGEPTENLIPGVANPTLSTSGWYETGWTGAMNVDTQENALVLTATNGWHSMSYDFGSLNSPITVSFKAKLKSKQTTNIPLHVLNGLHLGDYDQWLGSIPTPTLTEYQEFVFTFTPTERALLCLVLRGADTLGLTDEIYIKDLQVEQNSHATPFVNGTRSATEGLKDLTGNTSIDLSNVSFSSDAQMEFDGTDDRGVIQHTPVLDISDSITVEAIVKYDGQGGGGEPYSVITYKGYPWTWLLEDQGGKYNFRISTLDASDSNLTSGFSHGIGNWHHVVATYNGSTQAIYVNGVLKNSKSLTGTINTSSTTVRVGSYTNNNYVHNGQIPVVKVYNKALTAAEVQANFNNYKTRFNIA